MKSSSRMLGHRQLKGNPTSSHCVGQEVTISVDAYGKKYKGHVQSVAGGSGGISFQSDSPGNATAN